MTILRFDQLTAHLDSKLSLKNKRLTFKTSSERAGRSDEVIPGTSSGTVGTSKGEKRHNR